MTTERDEELVRYALNAADIHQQDEAWEAFNRITTRLAEAEEELAQWRATGESVTRNEHDLAARLAEIIGYCAQEGCDGEPYDTIHAIATGAYSTRGGGGQP